MSIDLVGRVRRWTRALPILGAAVVAASCSDRSSLGPIAPGHARLALAPRFATVPGAPTVPLSRVEGSLTSPAGDSTFAKANFVDGSASLEFDVQLLGDNTDFVLDLVGFDINGVEAYRAHQVYHLKAGLNDDLDQPVLTYSAPDSKVVSLQLSAGSTTLDPGATTKMSVTGTGANEAPISPIRVGWTSRNTAIATVDDSGVVTAAQLTGTTYIVARTPANVADSMRITTRGAVAQVVATPTSLSLFRGSTGNVSAEVRDPAGTVISDRPATFASADEKIATVSAAGVVTGIAIGATTITATVAGKSASVPVTVASPLAGVELTPPTVTLAKPGDTQLLTARVIPQPGASVTGLVPSLTTSDATVATVGSDGRITATGYGVATITATIETFSASTSVAVVSPLVLTPGTAEKLPKGTQQFEVSAGGKGPFTWTVNNIPGGDDTYGRITADGMYTAPAVTPTPATFNVCAAQVLPATSGCALVTIKAVPTSGADIIVFNDINIFNSPTPESQEPMLSDSANNRQLFRNIVNYTAPGSRATQHKVALYFGHLSQLDSFPGDAHFDALKNEFTQAGFTTDSLVADLTAPLDPAYKVIMLFLPTTSFSNIEINNLKQFSAEGGRIVFIGEWIPLYIGGPVENDFLTKMGAQMTNSGGSFDGGGVNLPTTSLRQHQLTTGMTGLWIAAASEVVPGPNDFAIIYDSSNSHVLVAAAKVDVTPLSTDAAAVFRQTNRRPLKATGRVPGTLSGRPVKQP